jgi:hypothetical protein
VNPYIDRAQFNWSTSYLVKTVQKGAGNKVGKGKGNL